MVITLKEIDAAGENYPNTIEFLSISRGSCVLLFQPNQNLLLKITLYYLTSGFKCSWFALLFRTASRFRDVWFGPKVGKNWPKMIQKLDFFKVIEPKPKLILKDSYLIHYTSLGLFKTSFQFWILILKIPKCFPFGANLTQFWQ